MPARLANLVGPKLRTPPIPVILDALPQAIPFGQVYSSLQSHVVDGIEPELRDYQDQKWFWAAKYLSISNYIWTAHSWYINKDRYDGLPADQRAAIDHAAADTVAWYRTQLDMTYARVLSELQAKGMQADSVDTAPFKAAVAPFHARYEQVWGKPFVERIVAVAGALATKCGPLDRVTFTDSGSETVHLACRIARAVTGRSHVAKIAAGYDGWYDDQGSRH